MNDGSDLKSWKCKTCKKIFEKASREVSVYEPGSLVRMTVCPYCGVPRMVYPILRRAKT